jgi:hypothetical protein
MVAASMLMSSANAESLRRALDRARSKSPELASVMADPAAKVVSAGRVLTPAEVNADVPQLEAAVVRRVGTSPEELPVSERGALISGLKPVAAYALPIRFVGFSKDSTQEDPQPIAYEPVILVLKALSFQPDLRRFVAKVAIGLRNRTNPQDQSILPQPVSLLISSDGEEVTPSDLKISRLGEPVVVTITAISPAVPFNVGAATTGFEADAVAIPVVRPTLIVEPARASINGLGLEKTIVHIQADKISSAEGMQISIATSSGEVRPPTVTLDAQGRATVELRSAGIGAAELRASGPPFESGVRIVDFGKPWSSAAAALIGAIVGWVLLHQSRRKKTVWSIIVALASSAFVVAAYSIGIQLANWAPDANVGEALIFFIAAVGAFFGATALVKPGGNSSAQVMAGIA